jgi:hypothetical protein
LTRPKSKVWIQYHKPDGQETYRSELSYWKDWLDWKLYIHDVGYIFEYPKHKVSRKAERWQIHALNENAGVVITMFHRARPKEFDPEIKPVEFPRDPETLLSLPPFFYVNICKPNGFAFKKELIKAEDWYVDVVRYIARRDIHLTDTELKRVSNLKVSQSVALKGFIYDIYEPKIVDVDELGDAVKRGVLTKADSATALRCAKKQRAAIRGGQGIYGEVPALFRSLLALRRP